MASTLNLEFMVKLLSKYLPTLTLATTLLSIAPRDLSAARRSAPSTETELDTMTSAKHYYSGPEKALLTIQGQSDKAVKDIAIELAAEFESRYATLSPKEQIPLKGCVSKYALSTLTPRTSLIEKNSCLLRGIARNFWPEIAHCLTHGANAYATYNPTGEPFIEANLGDDLFFVLGKSGNPLLLKYFYELINAHHNNLNRINWDAALCMLFTGAIYANQESMLTFIKDHLKLPVGMLDGRASTVCGVSPSQKIALFNAPMSEYDHSELIQRIYNQHAVFNEPDTHGKTPLGNVVNFLIDTTETIEHIHPNNIIKFLELGAYIKPRHLASLATKIRRTLALYLELHQSWPNHKIWKRLLEMPQVVAAEAALCSIQ